MTLVNLTPHPINLLVWPDGNEPRFVTINPERGVETPRLETCEKNVATIVTEHGNVALKEQKMGEIVNLPDERPDFRLIVSSLVAQAAVNKGRTDVVCPGGQVRGQHGQVTGATYLVRPTANETVRTAIDRVTSKAGVIYSADCPVDSGRF